MSTCKVTVVRSRVVGLNLQNPQVQKRQEFARGSSAKNLSQGVRSVAVRFRA